MSDPFDTLDDVERESLEAAAMPSRSPVMLATLTDKRFSDPDWIYERKLDGERAIAMRDGKNVRLVTRNHKDIASTYPEIVEALRREATTSFVVDGEVVAFDGKTTSFARLQKRMQITNPEAAKASGVAVFFYLFDLTYLAGRRTERLALRTRKRLLLRAMSFDGALRFLPHRNEDGEAYFKEACSKGWEGLIAKRAGAPYSKGRSRDWLKFKCKKGQELVIGGFTEPKGSRTGFGALLVGYYDDGELRYAGKVGTGFDEEELWSLHRRMTEMAQSTSPYADDVNDRDVTWISPELVGEFGFTEWTNAGKLRHPRYLGLRRDKQPRDVVRETPED